MRSSIAIICDKCDDIVVKGVCECSNIAFKDNTVYCDEDSFTIVKAWFLKDGTIAKYNKLNKIIYKGEKDEF